ncbi:MAG TPA: DNA repair protein RecN [Solirubrobacteraceae bacterium]|nr:DNA repair protein RecN [Solirubrobacteraceae bacterium]
MLLELRVENLLLIERAELRLSAGLNVLTGETGAGKTVLAHALDLLLGGRARSGIVRPGAQEAYVEGVFEMPESLSENLRERLAPDSEEIVLSRRVSADGRTRAYLNGRSATVSDLRDIGATLMSFYGQHEHRKLTIAGKQLALLDELCGPAQSLRLKACAQTFAESQRLRERMAQLRELAGARERELDLLEFELTEIDDASPDQREHDELLSARERMRSLDALCGAAAAGAEALAPEDGPTPGVATLLGGANAQLQALAGVDPRLDEMSERLHALAIESADLAGELRAYGEDAETGGGSPAFTLDGVEERLAQVERLMRKHGGSVSSVLEHAAAARERRDELAGAEVEMESTTERLSEVEATLQGHALALRAAREAAVPALERGVCEQLASLAMPDASFEVALRAREAGPCGADTVEFLLAANPGVARGALREIASGGELSRVMLALITACRQAAPQAAGKGSGKRRAKSPAAGPPAPNAPKQHTPGETLVFDEIDAGIGGHAARAVGARLHELAESTQLLCITHLPQIASLADRHFSIVKETADALARTTVVQLGEREVVSELVRMLGADAQDAVARRHARDLRRAA